MVAPANLGKTRSLTGVKALIQRMQVDPASVKVAIGWGGASGGEDIVTAIQVPGASPNAMNAFEHGIDPAAITMGLDGKAATVGGKSVIAFPGKVIATYVYIVGDTAFVVTGNAATAKEVLAALP